MKHLTLIALALLCACAAHQRDQADIMAENKAKWARPTEGQATITGPTSVTIGKVQDDTETKTLDAILNDPNREKANLDLSIINAQADIPPADTNPKTAADAAGSDANDPLGSIGKQTIKLHQESLYQSSERFMRMEGTVENDSKHELIYLHIGGFFKSGHDEVYGEDIIKRIRPGVRVPIQVLGTTSPDIDPKFTKFYPVIESAIIELDGVEVEAKSKFVLDLSGFGHK